MDEEKNVIRADKRPGSVLSILIFILVFTAGYLLYPQISMLLPFTGENVTKETSFPTLGVTELLDCPVILTARVEEIGKTSASNGSRGIDVSAPVSLTVLQNIKGQSEKTITLTLYGGSALVNNKKVNVKYPGAAQFEKGKTYLLFLTENGTVTGGACGALIQNSDGTFTDARGGTFDLTELKKMLAGEIG